MALPTQSSASTAASQFITPGAPEPLRSPEQWQVGDCIDNRYLLEEKFSGAMGHVFIAQHLGWGIKMAIKVPRPEVNANKEGLQRIITEADGWINLGVHPNIATCYFVRRVAKSALIFIEYVNGGTLGEWLLKKRCQDLRVALSIAIQFCNGMEYTHSKKIIHRDIKPQNILLSRDALVKITDFGIIRYADGPIFLPEQTVTPATPNPEETVGFRGTPNYASPEQLRDSHQVDFRTDIYSFGICLWMLFCGHRPYGHNSEKNCPQPQSSQTSQPLNRDLAELLQKCVQYDPDKRPQSFTELRQALHDVYLDHFKVACPFAQMGPINLEAEYLNNRAVSLAELGKYKQAQKFLRRALEIDDNLQEALINLHLLSWRVTKISAQQMQRRLQASQTRFPNTDIFTKLRQEVDAALKTENNDTLTTAAQNLPPRHRHPNLSLSPPKAPMELFRSNQLRCSIRDNIRTLAKQHQDKRCYTALHSYWQENGLRRDLVLEKAYDHLAQAGHPQAIMGIQRREIMRLPNASSPTYIHYNPTTAKLIGATSNGTFRLVTLARNLHLSGQLLAATPPPQSFVLRRSAVSALAICPSGSFLAIGLADGHIYLRSLLDNSSKSIQHSATITTVLFSPDNRWLAAGTEGEIIFYDLVKGNKQTFPTKTSATGMALLPNSLNFVAGCADGSLQIWDFANQQLINTIDAHVLPISAMALSWDGKRVATAGEDRLLRVWEVANGNCLSTIEDYEDMATSLLFGHDDFSLFASNNNDLLKIWDIKSGKNIMILDGRGDGISQLIAGPLATTFISSSINGSVVLWKIIYNLDFDP